MANAVVCDSSSNGLKEEDFECLLCLRLLYEPTTLKCGHSFCRNCCTSLIQQKHAKCPTCRKVLPIVHYYASEEMLLPSFTLSRMLETAFPAQYQQRRLEEEGETQATSTLSSSSSSTSKSSSSTTILPLFYLDPMLPRQRMTLNVFEYRYILMISRCLEGSRTFGMVGFSQQSRTDTTLTTATMPYGVEVEIVESSPQPTGTIHIQVRAKRRFEIVGETWRQDGYAMANIKWLQLPRTSSTSGDDDQQDRSPEAIRDNNERETNTISSTSQVLEMARELEPLVEEWKSLVISEGWQRYHGQLAQTLSSIGPMPDAHDVGGAVDRALWVGALINPLPGMGVAPEIRPALLENAAFDDDYELVLQTAINGIRQSIEYLTPNAVVLWIQYQFKRLVFGLNDALGPPPPLPGTHQLVNALLRLMVVILVLGFFWSQILTPKTSSIVIAAMRNDASTNDL